MMLVDEVRIVWFWQVVAGFAEHQRLLEEEEVAGHPLGTREPPREPPARAARHQDVALGHLETRAY